VEDLWDSIAEDAPEYELSAGQAAALDARLDALDADPRSGTEWRVAKERILASL
jgi:putative addiction module component (TIGR02574 family)